MDTSRIQILSGNETSKVMFFQNKSFILKYSNTVTFEERSDLEEDLQVTNTLCRKEKNSLIKATRISFGFNTVKIVDKFELLRREKILLSNNGLLNLRIAIKQEQNNQDIFIRNCVQRFLPSFLKKSQKFSNELGPYLKDYDIEFFRKIIFQKRIRRKFIKFLKKKIPMISFRSIVFGRNNTHYEIKNDQKLLDLMDEVLTNSSTGKSYEIE